MKIAKMANAGNLHLVDDAVAREHQYTPEIMEKAGHGTIPLLIHYGPQCNYFSLFKVKAPFETANKTHPGYPDEETEGLIELVAQLIDPNFVQIGFSPEGIERLAREKRLPNQPNVWISVWGPNSAEKARVSKLGYITIMPPPYREMGTVIVSDGCKSQLAQWGITDDPIIGEFLG